MTYPPHKLPNTHNVLNLQHQFHSHGYGLTTHGVQVFSFKVSLQLSICSKTLAFMAIWWTHTQYWAPHMQSFKWLYFNRSSMSPSR